MQPWDILKNIRLRALGSGFRAQGSRANDHYPYSLFAEINLPPLPHHQCQVVGTNSTPKQWLGSWEFIKQGILLGTLGIKELLYKDTKNSLSSKIEIKVPVYSQTQSHPFHKHPVLRNAHFAIKTLV